MSAHLSGGQSASRPLRYSERSFPPYSYVPGLTPHPVSDPRGHMFGLPHESASPLEPSAWQTSAAYRYAIDLFNGGFYWESHEAWESLWHAAGRRGPVATWLKAMIKLAAAGVKAREGNAVGVARHAARSLALAAELRAQLPAGANMYCGVSLETVDRLARQLLEDAAAIELPSADWRFTERLDLADP